MQSHQYRECWLTKVVNTKRGHSKFEAETSDRGEKGLRDRVATCARPSLQLA